MLLFSSKDQNLDKSWGVSNTWIVPLVFIIIQIYFRMQTSDRWSRQWITIQNRGVNSYSKMGGQVVMQRVTALLPLGAFYSAKTWVGNCRLCPPTIDTPAKQIALVKPNIAILLESRVEEINQSTWIRFYCIFHLVQMLLHLSSILGLYKKLRVVASLSSEITCKPFFISFKKLSCYFSWISENTSGFLVQ